MQRFWDKVEKGTAEQCWHWTAAKSNGYGRYMSGSRTDGTRKQVQAHRFAYELLIGPIPGGTVIDHLCRNPACVNPAHMEPVTQWVNTQRGISPIALIAAEGRTHCPQGHPYDLLNTYFYRSGRYCRTCNRVSHFKRRYPPYTVS